MTKTQQEIINVVSPYVMSSMELPSYRERLDQAEMLLEDYFNEGKITESELMEIAVKLAGSSTT